MKVVFHEKFKRSDYASNGASAPGRMESIMTVLKADGYIIVSPVFARQAITHRKMKPGTIVHFAIWVLPC